MKDQTPEQRAGERIARAREAFDGERASAHRREADIDVPSPRVMTQKKLAEEMTALGHRWQQSTVAKTEKAERPLRVNELVDLAALLGVAVADLVGDDEVDWSQESVVRELRKEVLDLQLTVARLSAQMARAAAALLVGSDDAAQVNELVEKLRRNVHRARIKARQLDQDALDA